MKNILSGTNAKI